MTAERLSAYQAFIIAAGELFLVLTAAARRPPPERFLAAIGNAVAAIDRAYSSLLPVASQDAFTAATEVVHSAHRIREFLDPFQPSPQGLGELTQDYASACSAFTRITRDEVGDQRPLKGRPCRKPPGQPPLAGPAAMPPGTGPLVNAGICEGLAE